MYNRSRFLWITHNITTKWPEASNHACSKLCIFIISDKASLSAVLNPQLNYLYFSIIYPSLSHHILQPLHTCHMTNVAPIVEILHTKSSSKCFPFTFAVLRIFDFGVLLCHGKNCFFFWLCSPPPWLLC